MDDRVQSPICQRRFVLPGMECVSKLLGFRWGPTPTPRKPHGGEGTAARCSQVAKVPYMASSSSLRWLPSRHRHCFRRRLLRRAGERAWRPRPPPAILTTEQLQRVDGRQASPRHTSRLPGSEGGLCRENRVVPDPEPSKLSPPHAQLHRDWMGACVAETEAGACRG